MALYTIKHRWAGRDSGRHYFHLPTSFLTLCLSIATGDQIKCTVLSSKLVDFFSAVIVGNIWDDVSAQLDKLYNKSLVVFKQF